MGRLASVISPTAQLLSFNGTDAVVLGNQLAEAELLMETEGAKAAAFDGPALLLALESE
mgnify:CR=1 FL=1